MNNTSTVAYLARRAGRWAVIGTVMTIFGVAASSCVKEDDDKDKGRTAAAGSGNGDDDDDATAGAAGEAPKDEGSSFSEACAADMDQDTIDKMEACGSSNSEAKQLKVNMLIVLDKSGSMNNVPAGYDATLWESVKSALEGVLDDTKNRINYAMVLYPFPEDPAEPIRMDCETNCCEMPAAADMNVGFDEQIKASTGEAPDDPAYKRILDALDDTEPGGGTPTALALRHAREYLQRAKLDGATYLLLATDGGPNCNPEASSCSIEQCTTNIDGKCDPDRPELNCCGAVPIGCVDDDETRSAIADLAGDGVKTYVVGIPGSEPYEAYLDAFAEAGGVPNEDPDDPDAPKYYRVSEDGGSAALAATFKRITEELVTSCKIPLASGAPEPEKVNVAVNCVMLPKEDADGNEQWKLNQDATVVTILGEDCEAIEENGARRVDVLLGCPTLGVY